jgi:hypothetical protein
VDHRRAALRHGAVGSICLTLFTKREPGADPPTGSSALTPPKQGEALLGRVLRDRANGLPREVAAATVTRPTARTVYLRFAPSAIGPPRACASPPRPSRGRPAAPGRSAAGHGTRRSEHGI